MENDTTTAPTLTTLLDVRPPALPEPAVIHLRAASNLADQWSRFVAVMVCEPGRPMVAPVGDDELAALERTAA